MARDGRRMASRARQATVAAGPRAILLLGLLLTACSAAGNGSAATAADEEGSTAGEELRVVATTTVLGDVARQVVGTAGQVSTLLPPGADPHTFQPSASQVAELTDADLVVTNGAGLEEAMADALAEGREAGVPVFRAADHVDTLTAGVHGHDHGDEDGRAEHEGEEEADHGQAAGDDVTDPHLWMDPLRLAEVAQALGDELAAVADGDGAGFARRAQAYSEELTALDADIGQLLGDLPAQERVLVTNHDALAYFADRYGFEIAGTVIPTITTGAEPSAQDIEELAATIREEQVGAIFAETTQPDRLARTVAAEVGRDVEVVELYTGSLGGTDGTAATYIDMMRTNAERIAAAVAG